MIGPLALSGGIMGQYIGHSALFLPFAGSYWQQHKKICTATALLLGTFGRYLWRAAAVAAGEY